jgi:hypothetical protein
MAKHIDVWLPPHHHTYLSAGFGSLTFHFVGESNQQQRNKPQDEDLERCSPKQCHSP